MNKYQRVIARGSKLSRRRLKPMCDRSVGHVARQDLVRMKNCFCILAVMTVAILGCASNEGILGVDQLADIPAGTLPKPNGKSVCEWNTTQALNAAIDREVFYRADFVGDSAQIAPSALRQFSERLQSADASQLIGVILEPSGDALLDRERSDSVMTFAARLGLGDSIDLQIAYPSALGLLGGEAERLGRAASGTGRGGQNNGGRAGGGFGNQGGGGGGFSRAGGIF